MKKAPGPPGPTSTTREPAAVAARRARVLALKAAVAAGRYEPDASALADRLLARGVLSSEGAEDLSAAPSLADGDEEQGP